MTALTLAYSHLTTVLPAALVGAFLLAGRKGTPRHRLFGKIYMLLIITTAVITLFIPAEVGPRTLGHFGFIHGLSVFALWAVPFAYCAARRGDIIAHKRAMRGLYTGGILIAGAFAFTPGRLLHNWLFP